MLIYNSLSGKKEEFKPFSDKEVSIYVCGITPYDTTHLGHAFLYVFFDALRRYLIFKGFNVNFVQNLTDIDNSILERAKELGKNWKELGDFWNERFLLDMKDLNVLFPSNYVRATNSIPKIIEITQSLLKKNFAYQVSGNVYFDVKKFPKYGNLSKFNEDQMLLIAKERGGNIEDKNKQHPLDFILWQKSLEGEPFWDSPWGKGRPGWHIECSAMINQFLGSQIDIHGGGKDLIFPHHESEIAQSESYTAKFPFVKYWMHTSMLMYQGEKMSKSLGNLIMVKDLLKNYSPNAIRWVLLSHHYRTPFEFNMEEIIDAEKITKLIENSFKKTNSLISPDIENKLKELMDDDLNTPEVLKMIVDQKDENSIKEIYELLGFKS